MTVRPADLARTLRRRAVRAMSEDTARAVRARRRLDRAVRERVEAGRLGRTWLIGSLAWGGFGTRSDVDVVVEGVAPEQVPALWAELGAEVGELVELLRIEDLPAPFQERVRQEGVRLDVT